MYRKILTLLLLNLWLFSSAASQGIIIDHNCTDISQIPSNIIDSVKQNRKFQWAGTSHAHQITRGLKFLEVDNPNLDVTIGDGTSGSDIGGFLPEPNNTFCIMDGVQLYFSSNCGSCCLGIGPEAYWQGQDAWDSMENTFSCFPDINISGWGWCGECMTYSENNIQSYLDTISTYESIYPNVQFMYTTGHAQTSGQEGYNRWQNNEYIRNYCIENDKILYDFGDLDCWYNGEFNYYIYNGDTVPLQHPEYNEDVISHTTEESCKNKARAMWYLMAKLSGWERGITVDLKVNLEGSYNGTDMNNDLNDLGSLPLSQPYNSIPWEYLGTESVESIPSDIVSDWVLVELRDSPTIFSATGETAIGKKAGFLLTDGSIVDMDGISNLIFEDITINNNLYVIIRHLSHLDIIGTYPATIISNTYNYDFTISETQVFGGVYGHKELVPGVWGMISGDANADGVVNIDDKNDNWINQSGQSGYFSADFNMGGKVDNRDKNEKWLENINKQSQVPE